MLLLLGNAPCGAVCRGQDAMVPVFTSDMNQHVISEGTQPGTVVYTLRATSEDEKTADSLRFFIRDSDSFAVNATTGEVILLQPLDREVLTSFPSLLFIDSLPIVYQIKEPSIIANEPSKILKNPEGIPRKLLNDFQDFNIFSFS